MSQPLLSIGMIVKNEERCLERCLKALEPLRQALPCELVIADTGSTDKTKEIAEKYADILFDFKWVNDFSKARNAVMDKCSGKWFLSIDADEYLISSPDEIVLFIKSQKATNYVLGSTIIRNYHDSTMKGTYHDFNAIRLVQMSSGLRYTGAIHEAFPFSDLSKIYPLKNTIFDHDGYTDVTPIHLKEKEKRNLSLLEDELRKNPDDIRCILHCLEAASGNIEKQRYFTDLAFKKLPQNTSNDPFFKELLGPPCISIALNYAIINKHINIETYFDWAFKTFQKAPHILIDVNFNYAKYLQEEQKHELAIKHCNAYLLELKNYEKRKTATTLFTFPLKYTFRKHQNEIKSHLINSLIVLERFGEVNQHLSSIDLVDNTAAGLYSFFNAISNPKCPEQFLKMGAKLIDNFFESYYSEKTVTVDNYNTALTILYGIFSAVENEKCYTNFSLSNSTIGISAKIANTKAKPEAEKLLNKIENFEEFMPLALKQALLLKCDLPKEFYTISSQRLNLLINDITNATEEIADVVVNHYCDEENLKTFPQISFVFNLLLTTLFSNNIALKNELKSTLINKFIFVAERYMTECYNENLLKNTEYINCIPNLHLFSWLLVNAFKEKDKDPLGYIKALKEIIQKIPQAKQIVEFLIEEFKNEEELKRQEKIKTASPELLAMAEQLKTMLKAFPENSPELLAIKQSPVYKQVAFLIED